MASSTNCSRRTSRGELHHRQSGVLLGDLNDVCIVVGDPGAAGVRRMMLDFEHSPVLRDCDVVDAQQPVDLVG